MEYLFVKQKHDSNDGVNKIYTIHKDLFEEMNVADTYTEYGVLVGHENAGDYHINNYYSSALLECVSHIKNLFDVDVTINTETGRVNSINEIDLYDFITPDNRKLVDDINEAIKTWCDNNHNYTKCTGFNYWDGNNYKSIIIKHEFDDSLTNYEVISDDDEINQLSEVLDKKEFMYNKFGKTYYDFKHFMISETLAASFYSFLITEKEDCDC